MKKTLLTYKIALAILLGIFLSTCIENHILPEFGKIILRSNPSGAEIYLNGKNTGKVTPDSLIELLSGEQNISLSIPEYNDTSFTIDLIENQIVDLNIVLAESNPEGLLVLYSDPAGANIEIDGEESGKVTPDSLYVLLHEDHTVKLSIEEYIDTTFQIEFNDTRRVEYNIFIHESSPEGEITLTSEPSGASIILNGTITGNSTPHTFSNLARGIYDVNLKLELYDDFNFQINLLKDEKVSRNTRMVIAGAAGSLFIDSNPQGAQIFLDDENSTQKTPYAFSPLAPGEYVVKLVTEGYNDTSFTVNVVSGSETSETIIMSGSLLITSSPAGASIYLYDANSDQVTPYTFNTVPPGAYDIKLSLDSYRDTTVTANVNIGELTNVNVDLTFYEPRGSITIDSEPPDARIFLNNEDTELFTPSKLSKLEEGNYDIRLELEGYYDSTLTVQLAPDQSLILDKIILIEIPYLVNVSILPENSGIVTGAGPYSPGDEVNLEATPNTGYNFVNWAEDGSEISTNAKLSFTAESDRNLVANFQLNTYQINAVTEPLDAGLISGSGFYNHGDEVSLSVTTNDGYRFVNWTENDNILSTETNYSFTAESDRNLIANFNGIGNLIINSDPIGANISLNNEFTGQKTPYEFMDLVAGQHLIKLDLEDFADTTITTEVLAGQTTDIGTVFLRDTTSAVEVNISYRVNISQQLIFTFVFNQDIRFDRVDITTPDGVEFPWNYNGVLLPEGVGITFTYPEKLVGEWVFRTHGNKVGGRQTDFDTTESVTVE